MQVVLFNIADLPLTGTFAFALRPYNAEGISPIYNIAFDGVTLRADLQPGPYTWPHPQAHALGTLSTGDLFHHPPLNLNPQSPILNPQSTDPRGFAHALLLYPFAIEPWEEAEFLAFYPVHRHPAVTPTTTPLFSSANI